MLGPNLAAMAQQPRRLPKMLLVMPPLLASGASFAAGVGNQGVASDAALFQMDAADIFAVDDACWEGAQACSLHALQRRARSQQRAATQLPRSQSAVEEPVPLHGGIDDGREVIKSNEYALPSAHHGGRSSDDHIETPELAGAASMPVSSGTAKGNTSSIVTGKRETPPLLDAIASVATANSSGDDADVGAHAAELPAPLPLPLSASSSDGRTPKLLHKWRRMLWTPAVALMDMLSRGATDRQDCGTALLLALFAVVVVLAIGVCMAMNSLRNRQRVQHGHGHVPHSVQHAPELTRPPAPGQAVPYSVPNRTPSGRRHSERKACASVC